MSVDGTIFVTGATGLVGANVCQLAAQQGRPTRALVRPGSDATALEGLGVEVIRGELDSADAMRTGARGAVGVIHAAALLGGTWGSNDLAEHRRVNVGGTVAALDCAAEANARAVVISTCAFLDASTTITEDTSTRPPSPAESPYAATKREGFEKASARMKAGDDVVAIMPGAIYGPSPSVDRALAPAGFNAALLLAIGGQLPRYPAIPIGWVLAEDVARRALLALELGTAGARYLALGVDVMTVPEFMSRGCAMAGTEHRVDAAPSPAEDPSVVEEFGAWAHGADVESPEPYFNDSKTHDALGDTPATVDEGLAQTVDWLRAVGRI